METEANRTRSQASSLSGLKILVVEDDYIVATECGAMLRRHGANVLGPVPDAARARAALFVERPDCILLDINLKGEMAFDLAREIVVRGIPVIFTTGYDSSVLPASLRSRTLLQKPVETRELIHAVRREARFG
jgi:DNA-binding response OmpR family regulator